MGWDWIGLDETGCDAMGWGGSGRGGQGAAVRPHASHQAYARRTSDPSGERCDTQLSGERGAEGLAIEAHKVVLMAGPLLLEALEQHSQLRLQHSSAAERDRLAVGMLGVLGGMDLIHTSAVGGVAK